MKDRTHRFLISSAGAVVTLYSSCDPCLTIKKVQDKGGSKTSMGAEDRMTEKNYF